MAERPGKLRIKIEIEHSIGTPGGDLSDVEPIETIKPVGLIEPVFPHQRRLYERQVLR